MIDPKTSPPGSKIVCSQKYALLVKGQLYTVEAYLATALGNMVTVEKDGRHFFPLDQFDPAPSLVGAPQGGSAVFTSTIHATPGQLLFSPPDQAVTSAIEAVERAGNEKSTTICYCSVNQLFWGGCVCGGI